MYPVDLRAVTSPRRRRHARRRWGVTLAVSDAVRPHGERPRRSACSTGTATGAPALLPPGSTSRGGNGKPEPLVGLRRRARSATQFARGGAGCKRSRDVDVDGRPDLELRSPVGDRGALRHRGRRQFSARRSCSRSVAGSTSSGTRSPHAWLARQGFQRTTTTSADCGSADAGRAAAPTFVAYAQICSDTAAAGWPRGSLQPPGPDSGQSPAWCASPRSSSRVARVDPPGAFRLSCDPPR